MALYGHISEFDLETEAAGWEEYCERLHQYFVANGLKVDGDDKARCKAIFLSSVGAKTYSLVRTLSFPDKPETKTLAELQKLIKDHLSPEPIVIAERYAFYTRRQAVGESASEFLNALRKLAQSCKFEAFRDEALRDMFVIGLRDRDTQKKLLSEKELTLTKAYAAAQAGELARKHVDDISGEVGLHKMSVSTPNSYSNSHKGKSKGNKSTGKGDKSTDPCFICKEVGHWWRECPQRKKAYKKSKVKKVEDSPSSDCSDTEIQMKAIRCAKLKHTSHKVPEIMIDVKLGGKALQMELDTGASVSLISKAEFDDLTLDSKLLKTNIVLSTITGEKIDVYGKCMVSVEYKGVQYENLCLYVVGATGSALLGRDWLAKIPLNWGEIKMVSQGQEQSLLAKYKELFDGSLGCVKGVSAKLHLRDGAVSKFCKPRSVPFAVRNDIQLELNRLVDEKILRKIDYSDWASPIVPVKKPSGSLRICGDYSVALNKHLKVPEHPMPNIEELLAKLNGGEKFSKLDLSQAYQQILLDNESQKLVAINTHLGLYTYNRVPYGISAAPSLFQGVMDKVLQGLECGCYLDDIVVTGRNDEEHLSNLNAVLKRLADYGFRLQKSKCEFLKPNIQYLGFVLDKKGIRMDESATEAIHGAPMPTNKGELQSFLGLVSQYRKFVSNMSTVAAPLNALLQKNVRWSWSSECSKAFQDIKKALLKDTVLAHYNPEAEISLAVDASPVGLGAVISHPTEAGERPVAFASRTLTVAERNYSQLDREALAIIYGIKKFHNYLYGRRFILYSDNLPLCHILSSRKGLPSLAAARIQRWAVELANFTFEVKHRPASKNMCADGLSRLPLPCTGMDSETVHWTNEATEVNIKAISALPVSALQIANGTRKDPVLSRVLGYVRTGWPVETTPDLQAFYQKRMELSTEQDCLLWGTRVVVPPKYQDQLLEQLHRSHPGIVRMKALARLHVWWPNIDQAIESQVRECVSCQNNQTMAPKLNHNSWAWPTEPWSRVHIDFAQINDDHYLIMVDSHSKWPEAIQMSRGTTADKTIQALRCVFSRMGLCHEIVSDNGPPFRSQEFENFLKDNGIKHILSAPYHPSSNGEAERFVQTFKKGMKHNEGKVSKYHICQDFLLSYRTTPHSLTGKTPSEMVFGRRIRTVLDLTKPNLSRKVSKDSKGVLTPRAFDIGDVVLVRDYRSRNPSWIRGVVLEVLSPVTYNVQVTINDCLVSWKRHIDQLRDYANITLEHEKQAQPVNVDVLPVVDSQTDLWNIQPAGEGERDVDGGRAPGSQHSPEVSLAVDPRNSRHSKDTSTRSETSIRSDGGRAPGPQHSPEVFSAVGPRRSQRTFRKPKYLDDFATN